MNCINHHPCCHLVVSTAIALNGTTSLNITIPSRVYSDGERFGLILAQAIPSTGTPLPVNIVMGGTAYPLIKPCGNNVMSDQLRTGKTYLIRVGTNPAHFSIRRCCQLCATRFVPRQIVPTEAAEA